jgi:glucose/mannose-6-phosphate isomerase
VTDGAGSSAGVDPDDLSGIARLDSLAVLGAVERFADQCREGWAIGGAAHGLPDARDLESVVVLGMGGSGVTGDVVRSIVEPRLALPFRTIKGYGPLPEWVGRNSLVFAISYSGDTEETLSAFEQAQERGARIVVVSSGGRLATRAAELGMAHLRVPPGLQPRSSLGFLTMPVLAALQVMGLIPSLDADVRETVGVLDEIAARCDRARPAPGNTAKELAARITGRIPVVYGAEGLTATAAYRFKCDLNEYAKTPAFWHFLPELDHNEVVGWEQLADLTSERFVAILLRDVEEHPRVALRFTVTRRLIEPRLSDVTTVETAGESPLARLLSLIFVTQLAAIYVGLAYGVDPGPVDVIQELKGELARS